MKHHYHWKTRTASFLVAVCILAGMLPTSVMALAVNSGNEPVSVSWSSQKQTEDGSGAVLLEAELSEDNGYSAALVDIHLNADEAAALNWSGYVVSEDELGPKPEQLPGDGTGTGGSDSGTSTDTGDGSGTGGSDGGTSTDTGDGTGTGGSDSGTSTDTGDGSGTGGSDSGTSTDTGDGTGTGGSDGGTSTDTGDGTGTGGSDSGMSTDMGDGTGTGETPPESVDPSNGSGTSGEQTAAPVPETAPVSETNSETEFIMETALRTAPSKESEPDSVPVPENSSTAETGSETNTDSKTTSSSQPESSTEPSAEPSSEPVDDANTITVSDTESSSRMETSLRTKADTWENDMFSDLSEVLIDTSDGAVLRILLKAGKTYKNTLTFNTRGSDVPVDVQESDIFVATYATNLNILDKTLLNTRENASIKTESFTVLESLTSEKVTVTAPDNPIDLNGDNKEIFYTVTVPKGKTGDYEFELALPDSLSLPEGELCYDAENGQILCGEKAVADLKLPEEAAFQEGSLEAKNSGFTFTVNVTEKPTLFGLSLENSIEITLTVDGGNLVRSNEVIPQGTPVTLQVTHEGSSYWGAATVYAGKPPLSGKTIPSSIIP